MAALYRGMDRAALDAAYNNGAAVRNSAEIVTDWQARSDRLRAAHAATMDLRYGPAERNRIDHFPGDPARPLLVFIHGGYWQMRAKEVFAFLAAGPLAHGIGVALVGYTLAPQIRLDGIVAEVRAALDFIAAKYPRIVLSGWSAGGHLTAMAHGASRRAGRARDQRHLRPRADAALVHQRQAAARRGRAAAQQPDADCLRTGKPLVVAYGKAELPELQRQSEEYAKVAKAKALGLAEATTTSRSSKSSLHPTAP